MEDGDTGETADRNTWVGPGGIEAARNMLICLMISKYHGREGRLAWAVMDLVEAATEECLSTTEAWM